MYDDLRKILGIKWQDKIPDTEVFTRANLPSIHTILMHYQLRWSGHVIRMADHRIPKKLLYGELQVGKRSHGGQKKRFKDTLKNSMKSFNIRPDSLETTAMDRSVWRSAVRKGAKSCEARRKSTAEERRRARKDNANNPADTPTIPCPHCQRLFRGQIGLNSHLRTHKDV